MGRGFFPLLPCGQEDPCLGFADLNGRIKKNGERGGPSIFSSFDPECYLKYFLTCSFLHFKGAQPGKIWPSLNQILGWEVGEKDELYSCVEGRYYNFFGVGGKLPVILRGMNSACLDLVPSWRKRK